MSAESIDQQESSNGKTMLAVRLYGKMESGIREFTKAELQEKVKLDRIAIPTPRSGQVLIKVAASAILPMNMSELKAAYGTWNKDGLNKALQCGSEGCGTVVASGGGVMAWSLVGKRVAFFRYNAAWAEYACVSYTQVMSIPDKLPWRSACAAFANPFTAISFLEMAKAAGCSTVVHTAAASTLGIMLIKHGKRVGVNVIAVVRRDAQAQKCLQAGAVEALNSNDAEFRERLIAACVKHDAKIAFDAVAGQLCGTVLNCLPNGSTIHVYGGLSEERPIISTRDLIFKGKTATGFWLKDYAASKSMLSLLQWSWTVPKYLEEDFASPIAQEFKLEQVHDAILAYSKDMGSGKILLTVE